MHAKLNEIQKFPDMISFGNLRLGFLLINGAYTFPGNTFWCVTPYLKCQSPHAIVEIMF